MTKTIQSTSNFIHYRISEGTGLLLIFFAIYTTICLLSHDASDQSFNMAAPAYKITNSGGLVGAYLSDFLLQYFSIAAFLLPLVFIYHGLLMLSHKPINELALRITMIPLMLLFYATLLQMWAPIPAWPTIDGIGNGGLIGKLISSIMLPLVGNFGTVALTSIGALLSTMWWSGCTLHDIHKWSKWVYRHTLHLSQIARRYIKRIKFKQTLQQIDLPLSMPERKKITPKVIRQNNASKVAPRVEKERQDTLPMNLGEGYSLPQLHMLEDRPKVAKGESEEALQQNARRLEAELANFGVEGKVTKICPGPVITIYELEPAAGVKTSAVVNLSSDLARSMSATSVRVAPIPGRNVLGIEMPNLKRKIVTLKELLSTEEFETHPGKLAVALGVDTSGKPTYADIAKMPHALIAGTTGSGKSVAMNAFILSLLYRMSPEQLRFVMIDPKMLELSVYNDIPHLLTPVIIDPHKASTALKWVVREMENRYKLMTDMGVKNLQSFNAKFAEAEKAGNIPTRTVQTGFNPATGQPTMESRPITTAQLPYIVVVIDELADLMMVAGKEVEQSIARIAQMARAAGIHLLVATQRPSVDVVTGLIKANIPTRFSFNVTSKIDSRTVLDQMGAEQLLGKGDMLYMENGANTLARLHGAFVSEEECNDVANHLKEQAKPQYVEITKPINNNGTSGGTNDSISDDDPLYTQAVELIAKEQKASTSFVQRYLKIGYNRAATIIDKMESDGLVSEANHVGKREVIIKQPPKEGY